MATSKPLGTKPVRLKRKPARRGGRLRWPKAGRRSGPPVRGKWLARALLTFFVICAAALVLSWGKLNSYALAASSYGARVGCSCRYIGGRDISDCRKDFMPGMGLTMLSADDAHHAVTARYLLLSSQTATLHEGAGCLLEPWKG